MAARFDRLRVQFENDLQSMSHHHDGWDHEQSKSEMTDRLNLVYLEICRKSEEEIAAAKETVKQEEMALQALRGKDMAPEDEIENAVTLLMKARRELKKKRNLWGNKRLFLTHFLDTLSDVQFQWLVYSETDQKS